jgi:hypothetical protein
MVVELKRGRNRKDSISEKGKTLERIEAQESIGCWYV